MLYMPTSPQIGQPWSATRPSKPVEPSVRDDHYSKHPHPLGLPNRRDPTGLHPPAEKMGQGWVPAGSNTTEPQEMGQEPDPVVPYLRYGDVFPPLRHVGDCQPGPV